jgi:hypothetical protein
MKVDPDIVKAYHLIKQAEFRQLSPREGAFILKHYPFRRHVEAIESTQTESEYPPTEDKDDAL